jgi:hypothetical protein
VVNKGKSMKKLNLLHSLVVVCGLAGTLPLWGAESSEKMTCVAPLSPGDPLSETDENYPFDNACILSLAKSSKSLLSPFYWRWERNDIGVRFFAPLALACGFFALIDCVLPYQGFSPEETSRRMMLNYSILSSSALVLANANLELAVRASRWLDKVIEERTP